MRFGAIAAVLVAACGGSDPAQAPDGASVEVDGALPPPDAAPVFDPGPEPTTVIRPIPGEVTVIQLDLPAGIAASTGEAAAIVGPDGTLVLLDVGNTSHDDDVRAAVTELNTQWITPARGFPAARAPLQVEWVIVTHLHGDHMGGFVDLVAELEIVRGVVHRGFVDLGAGMNVNEYAGYCDALRGPFAALDVPLCVAAAPASCGWTEGDDPHAATACPGIPTVLDLGGGATLTFIGANGHYSTGAEVVAAPPFGRATGDEENARSLVGQVAHGGFRYHFGGDLHGRPSDGPDMESQLVAVAGPAWYGALGVDVVHAHHHARRTSSNATFVAAAAPADGRSRNVVAGINPAYLGSPFPEVLAAWGGGGRLGEGRIWVTATTAGGATSPELVDADGPVVVQTIQAGLGYRVQAAGATLSSRAFPSVRGSP